MGLKDNERREPREFWINDKSHICHWHNGREIRLLECSLKPFWIDEIHVIEYAAFSESQAELARVKALNGELAQRGIDNHLAYRDSLDKLTDECDGWKGSCAVLEERLREHIANDDKLTTELNQAKAELLLLKTKQELEALANTKEVYRGEKIVQENAKLEAQVAELKGALENEQEYLRVLNEGCLKALKNDLWTLMADERINSIENTLKKLKPDQKE